MVAIDSAHDISPSARAETGHTGQIVLFAVLIAALLVAASLSLNPDSSTGWHAAAEMVARFSLLVFVAAMIVEPLARLIPTAAMRAIARERGSLVLAFAIVSAAELGCIAAPFEFSGESLSAPAIAYCALTGMILVVMLFSAHPATIRFFGGPAWRAMQRIATSYFWLVLTLVGLDHVVGPHRPDNWYGFSLLVLVAALLLRFTDSFVAHFRGVAQKVG
jgi:hypothetical protein